MIMPQEYYFYQHRREQQCIGKPMTIGLALKVCLMGNLVASQKMSKFDQLPKLQQIAQLALQDMDSSQMGELSQVLINGGNPLGVKTALVNLFAENCVKIGKGTYVLPLELEKVSKSKLLRRVCQKLNQAMAVEIAKSEGGPESDDDGPYNNAQKKDDKLASKTNGRVEPTKQNRDYLENYFQELFFTQGKKPGNPVPEKGAAASQAPKAAPQPPSQQQVKQSQVYAGGPLDSDEERPPPVKKQVQTQPVQRPAPLLPPAPVTPSQIMKQQPPQEQFRPPSNRQYDPSVHKFMERLKQFMPMVTFSNERPFFSTDQYKQAKEKEKLLQERGIHSNLKDFASFKYLCQLKSQFYQASTFAEHVGGVEKLSMRFNATVFKTICNPEEQVPGQRELEERYARQLEREPFKMREFREQMYRSIFLYFGPILDHEQKGWSRQIGRMNESERARYRQRRMEYRNGPTKDFTEVQERNQRYCWYDALVLLTSKLKYYTYLQSFREHKQEYKECYDVILALMLMIESPTISDQAMDVM